MSDAEQFDVFYADARDRLLVQAFALTGDLPASRGAVRDSFIAAWHRWPKLRRLDDPESWVRPHVLTHAQRRHTARIFHRDRKLDPELRATLDALHKLPVTSRKALLLAELSTASAQERAREIGLPFEDAERRLLDARVQFVELRGVPATEIRPTLEQLGEHCADQRWQRATIIRRAGAARRRTHALAGAALVTATLVVSGFLVVDAHGVRPTLESARDRITSVPGQSPSDSPSTETTAVTTASLLTKGQVSRAVPGRTWRVTGTDPAQHSTLPCQRRMYADPKATTALVRNFTSRREKGKPQLAAVQTMEFSRDIDAATQGFATTTGWIAGCTMPQTQLLSVRRVKGLGDEARQYALRAWHKPAMTFVLGIARTGRVNTVTLTRATGAAGPDLAGNLRLLVSAVDDVCPTSAGGRCSALPKAVPIAAPPAGKLPMMLSELDLPPVAGVQRPWAGTTPRQALQNVAATPCDDSSFHGHGWKHDATRSFLIPGAHLATAFGLTQTVGRLPEAKAKTFVGGVRSKLGSCGDRQLGTKVQRVSNGPFMSAWRVRTQVSDKVTVTFYMGIVRRGGAVAQVGFVPDGSHSMTPGQFTALVRRAGERLGVMPE
jgi:DNA-directed RNA polymerase specialized sigma24 family protein